MSSNLLSFIFNKLKPKRRTDWEDPDSNDFGPSRSKQRCLSSDTPIAHLQQPILTTHKPFPYTKMSTAVTSKLPFAGDPTGDPTIAAAAAAAAAAYQPTVVTNGHYHNKLQMNNKKHPILITSSAFRNARQSPPPQLLPKNSAAAAAAASATTTTTAISSRFSRVPPQLLPISRQTNNNGPSAYGLSSGSCNRPPPTIRSVHRHSAGNSRALASSTPKAAAGLMSIAPLTQRHSGVLEADGLTASNGLATERERNSDLSRFTGTGPASQSKGAMLPPFATKPNETDYRRILNAIDFLDPNSYSNNVALAAAAAAASVMTARAIPSTDEMQITVDDRQKLPPVNSMKVALEAKRECQSDFVPGVKARYESLRKTRELQLQRASELSAEQEQATAKMERLFKERLNINWLVPPDTAVIVTPDEELLEPEPEPLNEFPPFDSEQNAIINNALRGNGSKDEVLITKFSLSIRRRSLQTLIGLNWLDDEVINFYMNMLMERSEKRSASDGLPKVYAFNTFFVTRLMSAGHAGVRRWTRKVDVFSFDLLPVPVHVGSVHWCMAIIDFRDSSIRYYDSMKKDNPHVLHALLQYLMEESRDKRGVEFDVSGWRLETPKDIPEQDNQSDCGVFSCAFAETFSRGCPPRFSQVNMPWMRMKMVLEICRGELIL